MLHFLTSWSKFWEDKFNKRKEKIFNRVDIQPSKKKKKKKNSYRNTVTDKLIKIQRGKSDDTSPCSRPRYFQHLPSSGIKGGVQLDC